MPNHCGFIEGFTIKGKRSFELVRNNLHGVEIVTFDEVLKKVEVFASMLKATAKKPIKKKSPKPKKIAVKRKNNFIAMIKFYKRLFIG